MTAYDRSVHVDVTVVSKGREADKHACFLAGRSELAISVIVGIFFRGEGGFSGFENGDFSTDVSCNGVYSDTRKTHRLYIYPCSSFLVLVPTSI
jgi:hypothetical protein